MRRTTRATTRARSTSRCAPSATRSCGPSSSGGADDGGDDAARDRASARTRRSRTRWARSEYGEVEITPDGGAIVRTGSFSHGQGHETTFAMIAGERLGLADREGHGRHKGDTDDVAQGHRHVRVEVDADRRHGRQAAADEVVERAKRARRRLPGGERRRRRPRHRPGPLPRRRGVRARSLLGGAGRAGCSRQPARRAEGASTTSRRAPTFPFGAHIAVVEVDAETGKVELQRLVARRRRGHAHQPVDRGGPGARRRRDGRRAGALRGVRLRRRRKPAHGHASSATPSRRPRTLPVVGGGRDGDADARQRARREGNRRVRDDRVRRRPSRMPCSTRSRPIGVRHVDLPCNGENVWRALQEAKA